MSKLFDKVEVSQEDLLENVELHEMDEMSVEEFMDSFDGLTFSAEQEEVSKLKDLHSVSLELFSELLDVTIAMEEMLSLEDIDERKALSLVSKNAHILTQLGFESAVSIESDKDVRTLLTLALEANTDEKGGAIKVIKDKLAALGKSISEKLSRMKKSFTDFFKSFSRILKESGEKIKTLDELKEENLKESDVNKLAKYFAVYMSKNSDMSGKWQDAIKQAAAANIDFNAFSGIYKALGKLALSTGEGKQVETFKESNSVVKSLVEEKELNGYVLLGTAFVDFNSNGIRYANLYMNDGAIIASSIKLIVNNSDVEVKDAKSKTPSISELETIHKTISSLSGPLLKAAEGMSFANDAYKSMSISNLKSLNPLELAKAVKRFSSVNDLLNTTANSIEWARFESIRSNVSYAIKLMDYSFGNYSKKK